MSVVKKYAPGGSVTTTDYSELEKYLKNKINKELTNKSIVFAEEILPTFIENLKSGNIKDSEYTPKANWSGRISIESPDEANHQLIHWLKNREIISAKPGDKMPDVSKMSNWEGFLWSIGITPNKKSKENINWLDQPKDQFNLPKNNISLNPIEVNKIPIINPESEDTTIKGTPTQTGPIGSQVKSITSTTIPQEKIAEIDKEKEEWKNILHDSITGKLKLLKSKEYSFKPTIYNTKDKLPITINETKNPEKKEGFSLNSKDLADVINVGLYANALSNINKNYRLTNRALSEQMVRQSLLKQPNVRIVTPNISASDEQVAKANTTANRVANSIADIDKALGYRAQVAKNVGELEAKTKLGAAQQTEQQLAKVQDMRMKIDQANTQIENANKGRIADIMSKFHQNAINANVQKNNEFNKFLTASLQNVKVKEQYKNFKDVIDFQSNPEFIGLNKEYQQLLKDKYDFNIRLKDDPSLANSQEAKNLELREKVNESKLTDALSKLNSLKVKTQYSAFMANGGSLKEKVTLENIKQYNRKELEELKQYYKQLLKNDDLLLKSLIKIFK